VSENNVLGIGKILYTEYFLPFQISGFILLVAMIGAIVLTLRHKKNVKRQDVAEQIRRSDSVYLVNPKSGKGVKI
jgi:NADH-quinone oxidoreductase subunit J